MHGGNGEFDHGRSNHGKRGQRPRKNAQKAPVQRPQLAGDTEPCRPASAVQDWAAVFDQRVINRNCIATGYPRIFTEHGASGSEGGANPNHVLEVKKNGLGPNRVYVHGMITYEFRVREGGAYQDRSLDDSDYVDKCASSHLWFLGFGRKRPGAMTDKAV
jgi:hypothetical protein